MIEARYSNKTGFKKENGVYLDWSKEYKYVYIVRQLKSYTKIYIKRKNKCVQKTTKKTNE